MRTFVDLTFSANGPSPVELADEFRRVMGLSFLVGTHDLVFEWQTPEEFRERLDQIHEILRPSGAHYRVETLEEEVGVPPVVTWPPAINGEPRAHPAYDRPAASERSGPTLRAAAEPAD